MVIMWINNIQQYQFDYIASTMRRNGRGYEWHSGNYTAIKLTMEDWKKYFPFYLPKELRP
jgi:hypothetical protein